MAGKTYTTGRKVILPVFLLLVVLVATASVGLRSGTPVLGWGALADLLWMGGGEELARTIVLDIRLPRIVLGLLVGALLSAAGTLMQGALNNRLAGPELLGISAGASFAVAAITVLHLPIPFHLHPMLALAGGLTGGGIVVVAARGSKGATGMLLVGMAVSAMLNGLLVVLIAMGTSNDVNLLYTYLLGSLANRGWEQVLRILPWFIVLLPLALALARSVNLLQLGDETASGLGVKVDRARLLVLIVSALLVAVTVAQCGPIGYIALLAPHLTRALTRSQDVRLVLPVSALCGAVLLTAADQMARLWLEPMELPVGVWTTLIGGTIFLLYIVTRRGGGVHG
ncbi:FecCD family ABC transporter permease [Paenibacillus daejeonensis]|uniref:FecCD family ABC transporter permease n=1 Tax=Paenibacillus daejeonensis TaxID=135193 RepID=UPI00036A707C|nr:iron ABC transporter permease [Paenibacillus daejeonensis]